jgi:phosphonate metabolism protein PhnN/1,5-bisphosphokinase (PRPP-forming)
MIVQRGNGAPDRAIASDRRRSRNSFANEVLRGESASIIMMRQLDQGKQAMLVLVVGPSGAGKDTLLEAAHRALANDARFRFVRRVITRPAEAGGETHEAVTQEEFGTRRFMLQWHAHGLSYGIPADVAHDIARGLVVVVNASRTIVAEAARRFPTRVIEITAPAEVLARRLAVRARETASDVAERLARNVLLPPHVPVESVMNDASIEEGVQRFLAALNRAASDAAG